MFKRPKNSIIGSTADQQMDAFWAEYSATLPKTTKREEDVDESAPKEFALVWHDGKKLRAHTVELTEEERQKMQAQAKERSKVEKVLRCCSIILIGCIISIIITSIIGHMHLR